MAQVENSKVSSLLILDEQIVQLEAGVMRL
jgi:hypothetical protein